MLEADGIRAHLEHGEAWQIHVAQEVTSTNDAVLALPRGEGSLGVVLFAESQTTGRGRRGTAWFSGPAGSNLSFSCALRPPWPAGCWGRLTHVTALALKRALEAYPPVCPLVKWPNDVYLGEGKVAGILTETERRGRSPALAVVGVGINVNLAPDDLPQSLRDEATSLRAETNTWIDREILAGSILDGLAEVYTAPANDFVAVLDELRSAHCLLGKTVCVRTGHDTIEGLAVDLGPEGELIIEAADGQREKLASADEVRILSPQQS